MGNTEGWMRGGGGDTVSSIDNIPFPHKKKLTESLCGFVY